jgi:hypothetical protein
MRPLKTNDTELNFVSLIQKDLSLRARNERGNRELLSALHRCDCHASLAMTDLLYPAVAFMLPKETVPLQNYFLER